jgi:hypothetical protein
VEDPTTWTRLWTVAVPWEKLPDRLNQVYQATCHEGNYGLPRMLANTRAVERLFRRRRARIRQAGQRDRRRGQLTRLRNWRRRIRRRPAGSCADT